jgi:trk system potassium uptake protein TrkA
VRLILIGGGETVETVYFLARLFAGRGDRVTVVNPDPAEARALSRQLQATILVGDGSEPAVLEEAGARQADVLISLAPYDPDNLVACQIAQKLYGVPRTLALINDPDNEAVFQQLGIAEVFNATRVIGSLIEGQTLFDEITHLFPADEGRVHVTEIVLDREAPAVGRSLNELDLPPGSLIAAVIREGQTLVPQRDTQLLVADRLILIALPEHQEACLRALAGT